MAQNTSAVFALSGDVSNNGTTGMNQLITAAANDYTGANANNSLVWTADSTNGGYIQRLRFKAGGTNVASVMRIYLNNGSANTSAANNVFYDEIALPPTTATIVASTIAIDVPMGFAMAAGFRIYVGLGTAVAAGWVCTPIGGKF